MTNNSLFQNIIYLLSSKHTYIWFMHQHFNMFNNVSSKYILDSAYV